MGLRPFQLFIYLFFKMREINKRVEKKRVRQNKGEKEEGGRRRGGNQLIGELA